MIEIATQYTSYGLSVIPVKADKRPIGSWKASQTDIIQPDKKFISYSENGVKIETKNIAIVAGKVSGNLECIDIDLKYDITGDLLKRYKQAIMGQDMGLLKKVLVEQTPSGGYHFIYRVEGAVEGNKKLAQRPASAEEIEKDPNDKVKVLLETRGEGGYFVCTPSTGYVIKQGSFDSLPVISHQERDILLDCALSFNECFEAPVAPPTRNIPISEDGISPLDDYNKRGDVLSFLISQGWKLINEDSKNYNLLRPGSTTSVTSAGLRKADNIFHCFSTSTPFDPVKGYAPSSVYGILAHGGNFSDAARELLKQGFGKKSINGSVEVPVQKAPKPKELIEKDNDDYTFLASEADIDDHINQVHNGTFKIGLRTGIDSMDKYYKFKRAHFNIFLGLDNVGKSTLIWYLLMLSARIHNWTWIVYSPENTAGYFVRRMCEFYWGIPLSEQTPAQVSEAKRFIKEHFAIIGNEQSYTYSDLLNAGDKLFKKKKYDGFLWDPYNAVDLIEAEVKAIGEHQYHYRVATKIKQFVKRNDCCVYMSAHAATEALRRVHPKGAKVTLATNEIIEVEGFPQPPNKSDIEGGGKWAARADDFAVIHRYTQHRELYQMMEFHVVKVKLQETGGTQTPRDSPVRLVMARNKCQFIDDGNNPMTGKVSTQVPEPKLDFEDTTKRIVKGNKQVSNHYEPKDKEDEETIPF